MAHNDSPNPDELRATILQNLEDANGSPYGDRRAEALARANAYALLRIGDLLDEIHTVLVIKP